MAKSGPRASVRLQIVSSASFRSSSYANTHHGTASADQASCVRMPCILLSHGCKAIEARLTSKRHHRPSDELSTYRGTIDDPNERVQTQRWRSRPAACAAAGAASTADPCAEPSTGVLAPPAGMQADLKRVLTHQVRPCFTCHTLSTAIPHNTHGHSKRRGGRTGAYKADELRAAAAAGALPAPGPSASSAAAAPAAPSRTCIERIRFSKLITCDGRCRGIEARQRHIQQMQWECISVRACQSARPLRTAW